MWLSKVLLVGYIPPFSKWTQQITEALFLILAGKANFMGKSWPNLYKNNDVQASGEGVKNVKKKSGV